MIDHTTRVARREVNRGVLRRCGDHFIAVAALFSAASAAGKPAWWVVAILVVAALFNVLGSLIADWLYGGDA